MCVYLSLLLSYSTLLSSINVLFFLQSLFSEHVMLHDVNYSDVTAKFARYMMWSTVRDVSFRGHVRCMHTMNGEI